MNVQEFLKKEQVPFDVIEHREVFDAQRLAQAVHVSGQEVAKTVLLRADDKYVVAVLPATRKVDFAKAAEALGAAKVEMATEIEMKEHCPDCEMGVLPPFGSKYEMTTLMDKSLMVDKEIVFEGNTHTEAIRMKLADFEKMENPEVASFVAS